MGIKGGGKGKKGHALMALPASGKMQVKKKIVKDGGKGKPKERGGRRKGKFLDRVVKSRKEKKEMTPEQKEKKSERLAKRHAARIEKDGRNVVSDAEYSGEVVARGKGYAWVKPNDPSSFPRDVAGKLKSMNDKIRAKAKGDK